MTTPSLLEFARGPLFVATLSFMALGLLRRFLSHLWQFRASLKRLSGRASCGSFPCATSTAIARSSA